MAVPRAGALVRASDWTAAFQTDTDAWLPYTPTWTGTIGNGTLAGRYSKVARTVNFQIALTFGSTTTHSAATMLYTVPFAAAWVGWVGGARIIDASPAAQYYRHCFLNSGTQVAFAAEAPSTFVSGTIPITFAVGDSMQISGTYESAS